jgi:competence protein ComEA
VKTSRLITFSVLALFAVAGAIAPRAQAQDLPDGPGKDVVVKACTSCHDADNITSKKHTKAEWKEVVDTMVAYGAEVSDEQTEIITTYLAKYFGKESNLSLPKADLSRPRR